MSRRRRKAWRCAWGRPLPEFIEPRRCIVARDHSEFSTTGKGCVQERGGVSTPSAPAGHEVGRGRNRLFIIADAAAEIIAGPRYEAYLHNGRIVGARLWHHVADLGDLTFRLLHCRVDFHAKRPARRVLSGAYVHAKRLPEIGIAHRNDRAVA